MPPVRLVCDSTADLQPAWAKTHGITVVPLRVIFGEDELRDFIDIQPAEFYQRMLTDPHHPRTSQPSPAEFEEVFRRLGEGGDTVICTTISAEMSGTFSAAMAARSSVADLDIRIIDTRSAGPAHNAVVEAAVEARDGGGDAAAVVAAVEGVLATQRLVFTLENLDYLKRGGRIGGARALLGTVLNIKPILTVIDGKVEPLDRVRTYQRALDRLVDEVGKSSREWGAALVTVAHAACPDRAAAVGAKVAAITGEEPRIIEVGPVIGCHAGPGGLGVTFHARRAS